MKKEEARIVCLYDLDHTLARPLLEQCEYPWEALPRIRDLILELGSRLPESEYEKRGETVWVHKTARVFESAYLGENIIIGNVALYGATSGKVFVNGVAGERFAVRNSGCLAVVEGVGDHGCEYMTGGRVVVLGHTGKNFAAGMSGGIAYVLDEGNDLYIRLNKEMVSSHEITSKYDIQELKEMIQEHVAYTNSEKGKEILEHFEEYLPKFKKIISHDYERVLTTIVQMEEKGLSAEQAQIEAFYANMRK